jgi:hypothetical protein
MTQNKKGKGIKKIYLVGTVIVLAAFGFFGREVMAAKMDAIAGKVMDRWLAPKILEISPVQGPVGTTVTITGRRFDPKKNRINFAGGVTMNVLSADKKTLVFTIPQTPIPLCRYEPPFCSYVLPDVTPGIYGVTVTTNGRTSNSVDFTVIAATAN